MPQIFAITVPMQDGQRVQVVHPQPRVEKFSIINKMYTILWFTTNVVAVVVDLLFPLLAVCDPTLLNNILDPWANALSVDLKWNWMYFIVLPPLYRMLFLLVAANWNCACLPFPIIGYSLITLLSGEVWSIGLGCLIVILPTFIMDMLTWCYFAGPTSRFLPRNCNVRKLHPAISWTYPIYSMLGVTTFPTETSLAFMVQNGHPRYAVGICLVKSIKLLLEVILGSTLGEDDNVTQLTGSSQFIKIPLVALTDIWTFLIPAILWYRYIAATHESMQQFLELVYPPRQVHPTQQGHLREIELDGQGLQNSPEGHEVHEEHEGHDTISVSSEETELATPNIARLRQDLLNLNEPTAR